MPFDPWSGWWAKGHGAPALPMSLWPDEEPVRPEQVAIVPWEVCLGNVLTEIAPFGRSVVPFELAELGDRQLVVQGRMGSDEPEAAELDVLTGFPSVSSLVCGSDCARATLTSSTGSPSTATRITSA